MKSKTRIETICPTSADMARTGIELALLRYKVAVERNMPVEKKGKIVRL